MIWNGFLLLVAVVVAAVPWGLPEQATFILPFLTLLLVFAFSAPREKTIPAWLAFLAGLVTDILTAGPLGYWAFLFTLCHALTRLMAHRAPALSLVVLWLQFLLVATLVAGAGWALASAYYLRPIDGWPIAFATLVAMLACPALLWWLRRGLGFGRIGAFSVE